MDVPSLVISLISAAARLLQRCEEARECHGEAMRIERRIHNLILTLGSAKRSFEGNQDIDKKLLELHRYLGDLSSLLEKCKQPTRVLGKIRHVIKVTDLAKDLRNAECHLEDMCSGLHLAMQPAISLQVTDMAVDIRDLKAIVEDLRVRTKRVVDNELGGSQPATGSSTREGRNDRIQGNICKEKLEMGELLGEGRFGLVFAGTYFGQPVAIKKAKLDHIPAHTQDHLRCVCLHSRHF